MNKTLTNEYHCFKKVFLPNQNGAKTNFMKFYLKLNHKCIRTFLLDKLLVFNNSRFINIFF